MNSIDLKTVVISHVLINAVCVIIVLSLWLRNRMRFAGLGFWAGAYSLYLLGTLVMILRVSAWNPFSIVTGYTLFVGGTILMYMGLERFLGKRGPQIQNLILWVVFIFVDTYFVYTVPNLSAHIASVSLAMLLIVTQSAWLVFRRADTEMRSISSGMGIVYLASGLINLTRILVFLIIPANNYFVYSIAYEASQLVLAQAVAIALAFGLFLAVNRRLVTTLERDITEYGRAEKALQASETLFRQMFTEHSAVKLLIDPANGTIVDANPAAARFYGYPIETLLQMTVSQINTMTPAEIESALQDARQYKRNYFIFQHRLASGELRDVEIHSTPIQVGERQLLHSIIHDITERAQMDQTLRNRTNIMEALNQATLDLINRHEMDDILQTLLMKIRMLLDATDISFDLVENNDTLVTYAVTSDQPLKKGDRMRRGEGGWLSWQAVDSGEPAVLEDYSTWQKRRPLYEDYPIHAIMIVPIHQRDCVIGAINISRSEANKPFNDTDVYVAKQLAQMVALVLDNAQLYGQLQSELAESVRREGTLHEAQKQVIEQQRRMAAIDERQRMARDLHDSVNQSIHSLVLFSETLVSMLDRNNVERARQISERLQESARQALKETRLLLYQSQASIKEGGVNLIQELNARLANVELRAGVRAEIIQEGSPEHCPEAWHENLFWIAIEAMNNSLKHAQARGVKIIIRCFPKFVELEVVDDGRGFDTTKPTAGGYGLGNMQGRADLLGGKLTITSTPAKGTSVLFCAEIKE